MKDCDWSARYKAGRLKLLNDKDICRQNRTLFKKYFDEQEYNLKRSRGLSKLDRGNYRTLYGYILKFRNVNMWFNNKPWKKLTKSDIKQVYDDLEDGVITRKNGKAFKGLSDSYYSKIFKSRPFKLAGKDVIAKDVIIYSKNNSNEVRYITEKDFKKFLAATYKADHELMLWLAWDIGENIGSLVKLKKSDFVRTENSETFEVEYRVNLRKEILKRSRRPRGVRTNYPETATLLDKYLKDFSDDQEIFTYNYGYAYQILKRLVKKLDIKCTPTGEPATWKDFRSGMTCDLLSKGWSTDYLNGRLGHRPSSKEIDKYVNFIAMDSNDSKKKLTEHTVLTLRRELAQYKEQNKIARTEIEKFREEKIEYNKMMQLAVKKMEEESTNKINKAIAKLVKNMNKDYLNALNKQAK